MAHLLKILAQTSIDWIKLYLELLLKLPLIDLSSYEPLSFVLILSFDEFKIINQDLGSNHCPDSDILKKCSAGYSKFFLELRRKGWKNEIESHWRRTNFFWWKVKTILCSQDGSPVCMTFNDYWLRWVVTATQKFWQLQQKVIRPQQQQQQHRLRVAALRRGASR